MLTVVVQLGLLTSIHHVSHTRQDKKISCQTHFTIRLCNCVRVRVRVYMYTGSVPCRWTGVCLMAPPAVA